MRIAKELSDKKEWIEIRQLSTGGLGPYGMRIAYIFESVLDSEFGEERKKDLQIKGWSSGSLCMQGDVPSHYPIYESLEELPEAINIYNLPTLSCLRCGWKWIPRQQDVRQCPHCKSASWDKPKDKDKKNRGQ